MSITRSPLVETGVEPRLDQGALRTPLSVAADYLELTKPRIGSFVALAALTGGLLAVGPDGSQLMRVLEAAFYVTLTGGASSVFNQIAERDLDARMQRTRNRPLPAGRVSVRNAVFFGTLLLLVGTLGLALGFNPLAALFALGTLVAYVLVYTPLKRASSLNTVIGAIPGAMPPVLGYVALAGETGPWAWMLFSVIFAWQFPHFLAIAWLHREDYRRAGMKMLPALPNSAGLAGRQALVYALLLLPVSLLPGVRGDAGILFTVAALGLGLAYVLAAGAFALAETPRRARLVLYVSLLYLPLYLTVALCDPVVSLALRHSS